jgi:hypothetical protein
MTRTLFITAACVFVLGISSPARAQGFISPFVGFNYGGDAACPTIRDCDDKSSNLGISFGTMNSIIGFEEELGYARNFFDDPTVSESSILTLMSNVIVGPRLTFIRPYVSGGFGLMKTHVEFEPDSILSLNNNDVGWNFGGGVIVQAAHIGIRGDVRAFHGFDDLSVFGFDVSDLDLSYGRLSAGVVFSF